MRLVFFNSFSKEQISSTIGYMKAAQPLFGLSLQARCILSKLYTKETRVALCFAGCFLALARQNPEPERDAGSRKGAMDKAQSSQ